MSLSFRPAVLEDCETLAKIVLISHGPECCEMFVKQIGSQEKVVQLTRDSLVHEESVFSYKSCIVAETDAESGNPEIVGMTMGYPASKHFTYEQMAEHYGEESVEHLKEVYAPLPDQDAYYAYAMAAFPDKVGHWAGPRLCRNFLKKVKKKGYSRTYLHVWADNTRVVKMYQKLLGAKLVKEIRIPPSAYLPPEKHTSLLMYIDI